jgi:hypothetical protein
MKKVTKEIVDAFLNGKYKKVGNSESSGGDLFLHHNKIAYFDIDGFLWISNAGWESNTTKERLNALPNVRINQKDFVWYLNGKAWGGGWTKIDYKRELCKNQI